MEPDTQTAPDFEGGPLAELAQVLPADNVLLLARSFHHSVMACLDGLAAATEGPDWSSIREQSHDLKGISGTFGARKLQYLAESLEHASEPSSDLVASRLADMRASFAIARSEIEKLLSADIAIDAAA